jgi:tRNA (adenine57-N1/adenine58-N1)-methyltransferase catalytic subunit
MHEVLTRAHEIQSSQPIFPTISSISNKLRKHAVKKEERRQYQIKSARARREDEIKRKEEEEKEVEMMDADGDGDGGESKKRVREAGSEEEGETSRKKARVVNDAATVESSRQGNAEATEATQPPVEEEDLANDEKEDQNAAEDDDEDDDEESWKLSSTTLIGKPVPEMRGHTSYLTFAVLYPKSVRDEIDARPTTATRTNRSVDVSAIGSPAVVAATREGSVGSEVSDSFAQGE